MPGSFDAERIARELEDALVPALEEVLHRRRIFVQRARRAAQESLYYLGMLYPTSDAWVTRVVAEHCRFGIGQMRTLCDQVPLPHEAFETLVLDLGEAASAEPMPVQREIATLEPVLEAWKAIRDALHHLAVRDSEEAEGDKEAAGCSFDDARELRRLVEAFLDRIRPSRFGLPLVEHHLRNCRHLFGRRFASLVALLVVGFAVWKVEIVKTLFLDDLQRTVLVVLYLALPTLIWLAALYRRRRRDEVAAWDLGGRPFRRFDPAALEPDPLMRRWPEGRRRRRAPMPSPRIPEGWVETDPPFWNRVARQMRPPEDDILQRCIRGVHVRGLWTALFWVIGALGCWFFLRHTPLVTLYCLALIFAFLLWEAGAIDFWEFLEPRPMRRILLGLAVLIFAALWWDWNRWYFFPIFFGLGALAYWFWWTKNPRRTVRLGSAVVLTVAALLGLYGRMKEGRAAWESRGSEPVSRLASEEWPLGDSDGGPVVVMAASGGGSRAALYAGLTFAELHRDKKLRPIARNLQAVSSVSGGSLANATYVARRLIWRWADGGLPAVDDLETVLTRDFIRPTLRGLMIPGLSRGDAIEQTWQGYKPGFKDFFRFDRAPCGEVVERTLAHGSVGLGNVCLSDLVRWWRSARPNDPPPFPVPLFNAAALDGHVVVVSPLAQRLYTDRKLDPAEREERRGDATWVFDRDAIYGLEELLPNFDPPLSSAVRASANFPFGFPLVEIRTDRGLPFSPRASRRETADKVIHLTDGGALSNSGVFPLFHLLINERDELRRRGVLMIVVDASKMPEYRDISDKASRLKGVIGDQSPLGQHLHRRMYDHLQSVYGDRLAVFQIDLEPEEDKNVLTTWALSRKSRELLTGIFKDRWPKRRPVLLAKWTHLVSLNRSMQEALKSLQPLDAKTRAARFQELLARLVPPGDDRPALSEIERRTLQLLRDEVLGQALTLAEQQPLDLIDHERPPLD